MKLVCYRISFVRRALNCSDARPLSDTITVRYCNSTVLVINLPNNVHAVHSLRAFRTLPFSDWVSVHLQVWRRVWELLEIWVIPVRDSDSVSSAQHCRFLNSLPHMKEKVSNLRNLCF